ncbi:MAG TPA: cytochrome C oxidase subunit IV family protein [Polyangiales bacterium]|nr:cytochrome C oxidase subunit IV family protein [Polyangiales bacterium]
MASPVPDPLNPGRETRRLALTLLALLLLAGISWALAHVGLGAWSTPLAFAIAAVKAGAVALIFMRLSSGTTAARFALALAVAFIVLLMIAVVTDIQLR